MKAGHMSGVDNLLTEDMLVAETMGSIADRTAEYLGSSDAAVARFRRVFIEAARANDAGETPRGCSGREPYRRIVGIGILHSARVDWRECVDDLVK
jgi:phthalate 4,5-dioxygenase oxygenase subunit